MAGETCWCCRDYGLTTPATEDGLCRSCANRSSSACRTAHAKEKTRAIIIYLCSDCQAGQCGLCIEANETEMPGPGCDCEHEDWDDGAAAS